MPPRNDHVAETMAECINIKDDDGNNIGCYYKCKECGFEISTRVACVAHACREHTDEGIGPCEYCRTFYTHSVDMMKHHVNDCVGSTTGSDDDQLLFFVCYFLGYSLSGYRQDCHSCTPIFKCSGVFCWT